MVSSKKAVNYFWELNQIKKQNLIEWDTIL